jgi:hypothetical protein
MHKTLSIDWLQLYCDASNFMAHSDYIWKKEAFQTKQFKEVYVVIYHNEKLATVQMKPNSAILPQHACIVKFANRVLYSSYLSNVVNSFLTDNSLMYKSISRLDVACDFQKFANGVLPENLIKRMLNSNYLKNGRGKFKIMGEQKFDCSYQYLRFGNGESDVSVYLYNKTVELDQVMNKPYIRERWLNANLDPKTDTWRLEVSSKSKKLQVVNSETGEHTILGLELLDDNTLLSNYYFGMINHYFDFRINDGTKNKTRMQRVPLFDVEESSLTPLYLPKEPCSSKADKVFIKKLYQLDQELREVAPELVSATNEILQNFVMSTGLLEFYEKKHENWNLPHVRE